MAHGSIVIFDWTVHPLSRGGFRRVIFVMTMIVIPLGVLEVFQHFAWAVFATLFLLGTLSAYWLPTRYAIDDEGIWVQRWFWKKRKLFRDLKRVERDPNGLFVSPFASRSRLDGHRGLLLMEPPERDDVEKYIRERIEPREEVSS